jgi:flagellar assembly protein FliH
MSSRPSAWWPKLQHDVLLPGKQPIWRYILAETALPILRSEMATIIRKDKPNELHAGRAVQPVAFSFADMRGQADDYLETVRQEAAKIVQQAHRDAERIRRQAEAAGRKAAEAAAERVLEDRVAKRMQLLVPALEQVVSQIDDSKGEILSRWERSALSVITAIAQRVIRRELIHKPEIALDLIAEALRLATGADDITLHVNPTDYENMRPQIEQLSATLARLAPSQIVADAAVSIGGCRVESKYGSIDQQVESQLRRIEAELV